MKSWWTQTGWLALIILAGCDQGPDVYTIPKEQAPARQAATGSAPTASVEGAPTPSIGFSLPEGWTETPAGSMRAASISVAGPNETTADVAVIPLPHLAGREVDFVNLWREQMELAPITRDQLATETQTVPVADGLGQLFDLASEKALIEDTHKARILVVMQNRENLTWFFKMTGPEALVADLKPTFLEFLKSVEYKQAPAASVGAPLAQAGPVAPTDHTHDDLPNWAPPAGWQSKPPGRMLRASFDISSDGGETAQATECHEHRRRHGGIGIRAV